MPHTRTSPQADRFFARLDRFETECPHCGKLIYTAMDRHAHRLRVLLSRREVRGRRVAPGSKRLTDQVWNPCTQRLKCPWCGKVYVAGLLLYPVARGGKLLGQAPPDVELTAREVAISRLKAGGWYATQTYKAGDHVNRAVESACSCPEKGWLVSCPVHGDVS